MTRVRTSMSPVTAAMLAALAFAPLPLSGCAGYRCYGRADLALLAASDGSGAEGLAPGKSVRVGTVTGHEIAGKLEAVGASELRVAGERIPFAEIASLQVRSLLWEPTVAVVGALAWTWWLATRGSGVFSTNNE